MDKAAPRATNERENQPSRDAGHYKELPTHDIPNERYLPKNRKRNSNKFDDMEETPFTGSQKTTMNSSKVQSDREVPNCQTNTYYYFGHFCDSTSIHGFKFVGEQGRYWVEKIWWCCVVCFAICGSGSLIYKAYNKWIESPVLVTFSTTETPVYKIPFPAITICPEIKSNPKIFNFTDVFLKYTEDQPVTKREEVAYDFYSLFCDLGLGYAKENASDTISTSDTIAFLQNTSAPVKAENCKWAGVTYDCDDVLSFSYTSEGWCATFNTLDDEDVFVESLEGTPENKELDSVKIKKWSLENGYPDDNDMDTYPRRTMLSGIQSGFQVDLMVNEEEIDYICRELQGFRVTLHHPAEVPNMNKHFRVPLNQAVLTSINPRMIKTADELEKYSIKDRKCYLPGEKKLNVFNIYTQENCITECFINFTQASCGCVNVHMALMSSSNETRVCGAGKMECIEHVKVGFLKLNNTNDYDEEINKDKLLECGCLPSCTSLTFDAETSQTEWNWRKTYQYRYHEEDLEFNIENGHMSRLIVYYRDSQFMTSERHELYTTIDFLANCGGLLGLFCGFSFTSSMEILYYLTLRLYCNFKKYGRRIWSGAPELVEETSRNANDIH